MNQTIFRGELLSNFTTLPNEMLRDYQLSFKARGLLAMVLSNKEDWVVHKGWLEKQATEGREAINSGIKELIDAGYVTTYQEPRDGGKFTTKVWHFHAIPVTDDGKPSTVNRQREAVNGKPSTNKEEGRKTTKKAPAEAREVESSIKSKFPVLDTIDFAEAWDDWLSYRKRRRFKPYDQGGIKILSQLAQWGSDRAVAAIAHSITQNYQGIYEERVSSARANQRGNRNRNEGTYNEGQSKIYAGFERLA